MGPSYIIRGNPLSTSSISLLEACFTKTHALVIFHDHLVRSEIYPQASGPRFILHSFISSIELCLVLSLREQDAHKSTSSTDSHRPGAASYYSPDGYIQLPWTPSSKSSSSFCSQVSLCVSYPNANTRTVGSMTYTKG